MRFTRLAVSIMVCLILISARTIFAQAELDCITLIEQSLTELSNSCQFLGNDTACYGHKTVTAETNSLNNVSFQNAADRLILNTVASLSTAAANPSTGEWGLMLANMTPADPDPAAILKLILMGDAKITLAPTVPTSLQINGGFGSPACGEAPSLTAIAAQSDAPVTLKINGIDVQISSLVIFQQESVNAFKAVIYSGTFAISGGATAQAGQSVAGVMDNKGTILFWSAPRQSTEDEIKTTAVAVTALNRLGVIEATPIPPQPWPVPTTEPTQPPPENSSCGDNVTHVVQPGENLFRIAMRYGTSIGAISQANGISDPSQIVVGQTLVIPCGADNGTSSFAPGTNNSNSQPTAAPTAGGPALTIDCTGFNGSLPSSAPPEFQQLFNQFCQSP